MKYISTLAFADKKTRDKIVLRKSFLVSTSMVFWVCFFGASIWAGLKTLDSKVYANLFGLFFLLGGHLLFTAFLGALNLSLLWNVCDRTFRILLMIVFGTVALAVSGFCFLASLIAIV